MWTVRPISDSTTTSYPFASLSNAVDPPNREPGKAHDSIADCQSDREQSP